MRQIVGAREARSISVTLADARPRADEQNRQRRPQLATALAVYLTKSRVLLQRVGRSDRAEIVRVRRSPDCGEDRAAGPAPESVVGTVSAYRPIEVDAVDRPAARRRVGRHEGARGIVNGVGEVGAGAFIVGEAVRSPVLVLIVATMTKLAVPAPTPVPALVAALLKTTVFVAGICTMRSWKFVPTFGPAV